MLANRFQCLSCGCYEPIDIMSVDVGAVGGRVQEVQGLKRERKLRIATWNFSGLCIIVSIGSRGTFI